MLKPEILKTEDSKESSSGNSESFAVFPSLLMRLNKYDANRIATKILSLQSKTSESELASITICDYRYRFSKKSCDTEDMDIFHFFYLILERGMGSKFTSTTT